MKKKKLNKGLITMEKAKKTKQNTQNASDFFNFEFYFQRSRHKRKFPMRGMNIREFFELKLTIFLSLIFVASQENDQSQK